MVKTVDSNTPAAKAGVKSRDVIVALDGKSVANSSELRKYLYTKKIGDKVTLSLYRSGKKSNVTVTLSEGPSS